MKRILIIAAFLMFPACAQPVPENSTRFTAADVHPSPSVVMPVFDSSFHPDGLYRLHNATMVDLIRIAWDIEAEAVVGGPLWLDTERFEISAKASITSTQMERATMLQSLLAERFKLAAHAGEKVLEVYALTAGPGTAHLERSGGHGGITCKPDFNPRPKPLITLTCPNITIGEFAKYLRRFSGGNYIRHPVADLTGLKGDSGSDFGRIHERDADGGDQSGLGQHLHRRPGIP